jgi:hypothetical protein
MKFNFRKISAIAVSALMTGMTLGVAAAANYPAPFVSGGVANVAVVYGTGAGVSSLDLVQAGNIQDSLGEFVTGGVTTVEGGEAFSLDKASDHFNFNEPLNGVYATLTDAEMDFLDDGTYDDGTIDETYTQKITLSANALSLFTDSDYNDKAPTLGFNWSNNEDVLVYTLTFDDPIVYEDIEDTDFPLLGSTYYVLDVPIANTSIVLLDSADKLILNEGETKTVGDHTVSIEYISSTQVKFNVDGEITDKLADHGYEELPDGSYIVANEVMYNEKEVGISSVEFSLGNGKIELIDGEEVEVNDEDVDGLFAQFDANAATGLTELKITWNSSDDTFLTAEDAITMPLFEALSLTFSGLDFPTPEIISLDNGETMDLKMGNYDLPLFFFNDTYNANPLGEEDYPLVTAVGDAPVNAIGFMNYSAPSQNVNLTHNLTDGLNLVEDARFLVTSLDTDLSDIDTAYYEVTKVDWDGTDMAVEMKDLIGDNDIVFDDVTDTKDVGDITISIQQANDTHVYLWFNTTAGTVNYNTAVSEKGLEVVLPAKTLLSAANALATGVALTFIEADKDGDLGTGARFTATVKNTSNEKLHVSTYNATVQDKETLTSDVWEGYVLSDLASKVISDRTADEYDFEIEYYGEEVTADVQVVGGASTISQGESTLGNVLVKDTEVSNVATKNLIVVGGSCINSAAAALVGGAKCGAAWTTATGIGTGQFLIKGYADSTITSGLALLVAGYDAEDTVKATTYLTNKAVDTSKAYKGTTTTETAVVID